MELRPGLKDVRRPAELIYAYIVLSLLVGVRTEEARALRWDHVNLDADPPLPSHMALWLSVRERGETKTAVPPHAWPPQLVAEALSALRESQARERALAGERWQDTGLVFTTHCGTALDAGNVRKMFKRVCTAAGTGDSWTPREPRTSFVSLMSHRGVSIEEIAHLVGHASTGPPRSYTAGNCGPSSPPAPRSWMTSLGGGSVPGRVRATSEGQESHPDPITAGEQLRSTSFRNAVAECRVFAVAHCAVHADRRAQMIQLCRRRSAATPVT